MNIFKNEFIAKFYISVSGTTLIQNLLGFGYLMNLFSDLKHEMNKHMLYQTLSSSINIFYRNQMSLEKNWFTIVIHDKTKTVMQGLKV